MLESIQWIDAIVVALVGLLVHRLSKERVKYPLNMLQLASYKNEDYRDWVEKNLPRVRRLHYKKQEEKTPLVMTDRATRLYKTHLRLSGSLLVGVVALRLIFMSFGYWFTLVCVVLNFLIFFLQYWILILSNSINYPNEEKINMGFYHQAQDKIRSLKDQNNLRVLGITGSFGKTSTKFITNTVLQEAFEVQNTPSSYNTPMGLSKIINNELNSDKEVFIAELGAEVPGEIEEVADLVQPDIGVITAIGPTHMHLFKTIENIQRTKFELIESLPEDGVAIFNHDNGYVRELVGKRDIRTLKYGMEDLEALDLYAKDIHVGERGSQFILGIKGLGEIACQTRLLGRHNISNLLAAASVAHVLGMDLDQIQAGIAKVEPVDHRLNLIDSPAGTLVIDDTFNSNPVGARAALDVLGQFEKGQKIIITPGMVELGDMEEEENYKLGKEIARVVDYAILVGISRTAPIQRGILEEGFPKDRMKVVENLDGATALIGQLAKPGDVILFENDLPDNYSEV
ncbi:MAG: UDP-N-acetylmuramoyl-tripeptide--D-alanyl-D-alanine ligase [Tissierellia bacterium]|nr:UDP-N-acetylmuramoyl-tripeptide--D-alanyl-D-alanine ligase [Tissierellia bacterium]